MQLWRPRWILLTVFMGIGGLMAVRPVEPPPTTAVDLGPVESFALGSVTTFHLLPGRWPLRLPPEEATEVVCAGDPAWSPPDGRIFHLARLENGQFVALSAQSPRLAEQVAWRPAAAEPDEHPGQFVDPCRGDTYALDGSRISGFAPRGLDRYWLQVAEGRVLVDFTRLQLSSPRPERVGALSSFVHIWAAGAR